MSIIVVRVALHCPRLNFLAFNDLHFANTCKQRYPKEQINSSENKSAVPSKHFAILKTTASIDKTH